MAIAATTRKERAGTIESSFIVRVCDSEADQ
jgi:hypothetical protein